MGLNLAVEWLLATAMMAVAESQVSRNQGPAQASDAFRVRRDAHG